MHAPSANDWAEQLATGVIWLDDDLRVLRFNGAAAELLDVGVRGLRGQAFAPLLADATGFVDQAGHVLADGGARRLRSERLCTLQGRELEVDIDMQRLDDATLLLEVHAVAEAAHATPLSATLRGFAHEVKNPLAGLRGAAQLLQRRVGDADLEALAGMVITEADRLTMLADRLLHHGGRPQLQPVNVHALLDRVATLLRSEAPAGSLACRRDYDPSLPAFNGDADRLHQLFLNLARNARDAGATQLDLRTRVDHAVRLRDRVARSAVRVDVADNGSGVSDAVRGQVFQPLVSGRSDGTGLGLALAQEIAHEHAGELRFVSRPGATVFSLYIPLDDVP